MQTSSLTLNVDVGARKRIELQVAISVPLELVSPLQSDAKHKHGIGLLDTGAQRTLVSEHILTDLQALPHGGARIRGIHGDDKETDTYLVDLHFVFEEQIAWTIKRLEVAPLENSATIQVLIGMDVLSDHVKEFRLEGQKAVIQF